LYVLFSGDKATEGGSGGLSSMVRAAISGSGTAVFPFTSARRCLTHQPVWPDETNIAGGLSDLRLMLEISNIPTVSPHLLKEATYK
jgi:hypothetical protein